MKMRQGVLLFIIGLSLWTPLLASDRSNHKDLAIFKPDGEPVEEENYQGKVLYLDFFASWCRPCQKSFPWMDALKKRFEGEGLSVIAVSVDKDREALSDFLDVVSTEVEVGFDPAGVLASRMKVKGMPQSFLIDRDGVVRETYLGFRSSRKAVIEQKIDALLKESL